MPCRAANEFANVVFGFYLKKIPSIFMHTLILPIPEASHNGLGFIQSDLKDTLKPLQEILLQLAIRHHGGLRAVVPPHASEGLKKTPSLIIPLKSDHFRGLESVVFSCHLFFLHTFCS